MELVREAKCEFYTPIFRKLNGRLHIRLKKRETENVLVL